MYEFTEKKIREKFKQTEYGQKVSLYYYTSLFIFLILMFIMPITYFIISSLSGNSFDTIVTNFNRDCLSNYFPYLIISIVFLLYFDGKRDGAIEMFKNKK